MNKIFNEETKERFLSGYENEGTKSTLYHLFLKSYPEEYRLDKDLSSFTLEDIKEVIKEANPHNMQTAKSLVRFVKLYVSWCADNGLRKSNALSFDAIPDEFYEGLIDKSRKIHYSFNEFIDLLEDMINGQDQCLLALIFSGIMGRSFSQLREIKISDIDFENNQIYVKEREEYIEIEEGLMKYVEKAVNQKTYFTYNKEGDHNERPLVESKYLFRNVQSPRTTGESTNPSVYYTRLNHIRTEFSLDYLTPQAVRQSGSLWYAVKLFNNEGKLEYPQFEKIGQRFQLPTVKSPSGEYFNTSLAKEFISEENLQNLYNITIKF